MFSLEVAEWHLSSVGMAGAAMVKMIGPKHSIMQTNQTGLLAAYRATETATIAIGDRANHDVVGRA
jgi:hypothetical protein